MGVSLCKPFFTHQRSNLASVAWRFNQGLSLTHSQRASVQAPVRVLPWFHENNPTFQIIPIVSGLVGLSENKISKFSNGRAVCCYLWTVTPTLNLSLHIMLTLPRLDILPVGYNIFPSKATGSAPLRKVGSPEGTGHNLCPGVIHKPLIINSKKGGTTPRKSRSSTIRRARGQT